MVQSFNTADVLKLEVETDPTGPVNLVQNPSGDLGAWGWSTPVAGSVMSAEVFGGNQTLKYASPGSVASFFYTEALPVAAGQYVAASWIVPALNGFYRVKVEWLDSAKVLLSSATQTGYLSASAATVSYGPFLAPASTGYARLRFDHYSTNTGTAPTVGQIIRLYRATLAKAATAAALVTVRTNLITNPSFEINTTGWNFNSVFGAFDIGTMAQSSIRATSGTKSLLATLPASTSGTRLLVSIAGLTPYSAYTFSASLWVPAGSPDVALDATFVSRGAFDSTKGAWVRLTHTFVAQPNQSFVGVATAPGAAGTYYLDAVMLERSDAATAYFDGSTAAGGGWTYAWTGTAHASTSTATGVLQYVQPVPYLNILGPTHDLKITRDELSAGLLEATILDATLDPAIADTIRPGRRVRAMALDPATDEWTPLFTGKATNAKVTYDYKTQGTPDAKRARISLTATDNTAQLASTTRTEGVASIAALPYVLEGCGVPWNVNGSGNQVSSATVVTNNADAKAVDQVAITRDSTLGYAWVSRSGVLNAWDNLMMPTTVVATLDEDDYSDLSIDYDTERAVNTVNIKYLRINLATGETVEVPYGPYVNQASVDEWGSLSKDFTIQGIAESGANMQSYANSVLGASAIPVTRINSVQVPIRTAADVAKSLIDLYDLVTTSNTAAGLNDSLRVTGVEHAIAADNTGGKWLTSYSFAADGGVAPPQVTPSPAVPAGVIGGDTDGWKSLTHSGTAGTLRYLVRGGVMFVEGSVTISVADGATATVLSSGNAIPTPYRPTLGLSMMLARFTSGTEVGKVSPFTDGTITVTNRSGAASTSVQFRYSYPLG